jgi:hypothetical protein
MEIFLRTKVVDRGYAKTDWRARSFLAEFLRRCREKRDSGWLRPVPCLWNKSVRQSVGPSWETAMLVTMQNSELIDQLVVIANGNIDLVHEAIREAAEGSEGADLEKVVDYIVRHRERVKEVA